MTQVVTSLNVHKSECDVINQVRGEHAQAKYTVRKRRRKQTEKYLLKRNMHDILLNNKRLIKKSANLKQTVGVILP